MKISFNPNATAVKDIDFVSIRMSLYQHDGETIVKSHITDGTTISLNTKKDKVFRLKKAPRIETIPEWNKFCATNSIEGFVDMDINYGEYPEIISSYDGRFEFMNNLEEVDEKDYPFLEEHYDYTLTRHISSTKTDFIHRVNRVTNYAIRDYYIHSKYLGGYLEKELEEYPESEYVYIVDTFSRYKNTFSGNMIIRRVYACPIDSYDSISMDDYHYFGTQIILQYPHSRFTNSINGLFTILNNDKCKFEYQTMERVSGTFDKYTLISVYNSAVTEVGTRKPIFLKGTSVSKTHRFNTKTTITGFWDNWYDEDKDDITIISSIEDIKNFMDTFCQDTIKKFDIVNLGVGGVETIGEPTSVEIYIEDAGSDANPDGVSSIKFYIRNYGHANALCTVSISVRNDIVDEEEARVAGRVFLEKIGDNKEYDITDVNISKFNQGYDRKYRITNDDLVIYHNDNKSVVIGKDYHSDIQKSIDIFLKKMDAQVLNLLRLVSHGDVSDYIIKKYLPQFEDIKYDYIRDLQDIDTTIAKYYEKF